jgi:hypothetical protein
MPVEPGVKAEDGAANAPLQIVGWVLARDDPPANTAVIPNVRS